MKLAVQHIRRMNGGAQAHLMRCDREEFYVVKFKNNPQHLRTLANELLATRLASRMGICVPEVDVVEVRLELIERTSDLCIEMAKGRCPCSPGRQFGSRFPGQLSAVAIYNMALNEHLHRIKNIQDFVGIFVFDKWTCNTDKRQAILFVDPYSHVDAAPQMEIQAMMIDQGYCFNAGEWNFPDAPLRSLYLNRGVYDGVLGMESFEPWLDWLENHLSLDILYEEAERVPAEWYAQDHDSMLRLVERLYSRRTRVRELIWSASQNAPNPFANWAQGQVAKRNGSMFLVQKSRSRPHPENHA
jgi:hypothetical protein